MTSPILVRIPNGAHSLSIQQEYVHIPPIEFWVHGQKGIRLADALSGYYVGLIDADSEALHAPSSKVSYRVEWPGYIPFSRQKYARRMRGLQGRSKIATQVAQVVAAFVNDRSHYVPEQPEWRVGKGFIDLDSLYLVEIRRVSRSTWVPVLAVAVG